MIVMVAYEALCSWPRPRSYQGTHLLFRSIRILIALLAVTLAGTNTTFLLLYQLLKPVSAAANVLSGISKTETSCPR